MLSRLFTSAAPQSTLRVAVSKKALIGTSFRGMRGALLAIPSPRGRKIGRDHIPDHASMGTSPSSRKGGRCCVPRSCEQTLKQLSVVHHLVVAEKILTNFANLAPLDPAGGATPLEIPQIIDNLPPYLQSLRIQGASQVAVKQLSNILPRLKSCLPQLKETDITPVQLIMRRWRHMPLSNEDEILEQHDRECELFQDALRAAGVSWVPVKVEPPLRTMRTARTRW